MFAGFSSFVPVHNAVNVKKEDKEEGGKERNTDVYQGRVCLLKSINLRICTGCPVKLDSRWNDIT